MSSVSFFGLRKSSDSEQSRSVQAALATNSTIRLVILDRLSNPTSQHSKVLTNFVQSPELPL